MNEIELKQLSDKGLNLQAILNIDELPEVLVENLKNVEPELSLYSQIFLVGHGGKKLWESVKDKIGKTENPIDEYSANSVEKFLKARKDVERFKLIFPSNKPVGLQQLGIQAGWHYASPFRVGINEEWGSWFAYRAVALMKSNFETRKLESKSPCIECRDKACISSCPVDALTKGDLALETCMNYRKSEDSSCADRCLSRMSCPIAKEHTYTLEQIQYHYRLSYRSIKKIQP